MTSTHRPVTCLRCGAPVGPSGPCAGCGAERPTGPAWAVAGPAPHANRSPAVVGAAAAVVVALVAGLAVLAATGRRAPDQVVRSASPAAPSPTTTEPVAGTGGSAPVAAPTSGPCGPIPTLAPVERAGDGSAAIDAIATGTITADALKPVYGDLVLGVTDRFVTVDELLAIMEIPDPAERRRELDADGFRQAARRGWASRRGDSMSVLGVQLGSPAQAMAYGQHHLADVCGTSSSITPSTAVPGAVTYFGSMPNGMVRARFIAIVGDTEVNITLCTCRPGDEAMAAGERWARDIVATLSAARS